MSGTSPPPQNRDDLYDIVILGGGPAGLTAAIYGGRANLSVLVLEHMLAGGEISSTDRLDNYPGFPDGITGIEFAERLEKQALHFGASIVTGSIGSVDAAGSTKKVSTPDGRSYYGRTLIVATGTNPRLLGVPGEERLRGKGISFCATCDGFLFRNKKVAVIGGGDSAAEEALYLTRFVDKVILIHRRDRLRAVPYLQEKLMDHPRVEFLWNTVVKEFVGEQALEKIIVQKVGDDFTSEIEGDGAFLYVGRVPNSAFLEGVEKDGQGYIITSEEMETTLPGVFAAGDIRRKFLRQVVTAAADGAIAAMMALRYLD